MSRTPARTTQADISRALRAAKQCGAASIEIKPDGTIQIVVKPEAHDETHIKMLAPEPEIIL